MFVLIESTDKIYKNTFALIDMDIISKQTKSENMLALQHDYKYNRSYRLWIYSEIKSYFGRNILEIGSGIGSYIEIFLDDGYKKVVASDIFPDYLRYIRKKYLSKGVETMVVDLESAASIASIRKKGVDTIVAINVMEHIKNDKDAFKSLNRALPKGGRLIVLVPAHMALYSDFDRKIGHFRRYTKDNLSKKLRSAGFSLENTIYFNSLGALGWWGRLKIMHSKNIGEGDSRIFNILIPFVRFIDKFILRKRIGISVIAVAKKI